MEKVGQRAKAREPRPLALAFRCFSAFIPSEEPCVRCCAAARAGLAASLLGGGRGGFIWSAPFSLAALGFHKAGAPYVGGGWCFFCTCCVISGPSGVPPAASASFSMVVLGTGVQSCQGIQVLP